MSSAVHFRAGGIRLRTLLILLLLAPVAAADATSFAWVGHVDAGVFLRGAADT